MFSRGTRSTGGAASPASSGNKMSSSDASRIQSTQTKGGHDTSKGTFSARAQSAGARNANAAASPSVSGATPKAAPAKGNAKPSA